MNIIYCSNIYSYQILEIFNEAILNIKHAGYKFSKWLDLEF